MTSNSERILILGAGGPLGSALTKGLGRFGATVIPTGRHHLHEVLDVSNGDLVRERALHHSPTTVIYLVNQQPPASDPLGHHRAGADLRNAILASAVAGAQQFIFASSSAVYGDQGFVPFNERDGLLGHSDYAMSKIHLEAIVEEAGGLAGIATISLRIFNIYGNGFSSSLINKLVNPLEQPPLGVSDSFVRDYIHVDDVVSAFQKIVEKARGGHNTYNVATGRPTSNQALTQLFGTNAYMPVDYDGYSYNVGNGEKLWLATGFQPIISLEDSVSPEAKCLEPPATPLPPADVT